MIAALAALAAGLGCLGFYRYDQARGGFRTPLDILYLTLQLFSLESGSAAGPLPWQLDVARFLAPLVTVWAALRGLAALFRERFALLRLRRLRDHVVVCGLGARGLHLVKEFRRHGQAVAVIEIDQENDWLLTCRDLGAAVLVGDATQVATLSRARAHRAAHVLAVCDDDGANVAIAIALHRLRRERGTDRPLVCRVHVAELALCGLLERQRILADGAGRLELRVFNSYQSSARLLFQQYPPDGEGLAAGDRRHVHVVVVGLGQMGQAVVLQAARMGHYANGTQARVTVLDRHAGTLAGPFLSRYPGLSAACRLAFESCDANHPDVHARLRGWAEDAASRLTIVVCLDSDPKGLSCALNLLQALSDVVPRIHVRMSDGSGLAVLLGGGSTSPLGERLVPFGMIETSCGREIVLQERLDVLARAIHENRRRRQRRHGTGAGDESPPAWEALDAALKDGYRQAADHIPVKLRAAGCYSAVGGGPGAAIAEFGPDEVDLLARMEGRRRRAERRIAGRPEDESSGATAGERDGGERDLDRRAIIDIPAVLAEVGEKVWRRGEPVAGPTLGRGDGQDHE